jgi:hypothetical protein
MIKKSVRLQWRNQMVRDSRNICHLIPKFISLIAVTALPICGGRCAVAVDESSKTRL